MTAAGGASAVPADGGSSLPFSGGSGIMPAGIRTGARGARCKRGRCRRSEARRFGCRSREAWPEAEPLGCVSPSGKSRRGTPEGVLPPQGAVPQPARLRWLRNSVLRRSASFLFFSL